MPYTAYDTRELMAAVEEIQRPRTFLLDTFFPTLHEFDTESIDFDVISNKRRLAPFVAPNVAGRIQRSNGFITKSFKPAYVKPKEAILPGRALKRRAGERYTGEVSAATRLDLATLDELAGQREQILRRKEWMASSALRTGQVVVIGEDYPSTTVDFGRDNSLTVSLAGAARWGEAGVSIISNIEDWAQAVQQVSGTSPNQVVMDPEAWKLARKNQEFLDALENRRQMTGSIELGPILVQPNESDARYVGSIGDFDFWVYQEVYQDPSDDSLIKFMPDYTVILASPARLGGVQAQGAIHDADLGLMAMEYAPKVWNEKDPSVRMAMTQSAPLVVPTNVNTSFCATVR